VTDRLFPKERLDSFVDGVFAFAMTLLVVNVELPDDFKPRNVAELAQGLFDLSDTFLAYVITFVVLAGFWIWRVKGDDLPAASRPFVWVVLAHLFFVTLMPFSMLVIGRYDFAPAIWTYSGNMIFLALTAIGTGLVSARDAGRQFSLSDVSGYLLLIASAILSIMIAQINVDYAMLAYLLNLASPVLARRPVADRAPPV
jgi:uncharacterized membrane protein